MDPGVARELGQRGALCLVKALQCAGHPGGLPPAWMTGARFGAQEEGQALQDQALDRELAGLVRALELEPEAPDERAQRAGFRVERGTLLIQEARSPSHPGWEVQHRTAARRSVRCLSPGRWKTEPAATCAPRAERSAKARHGQAQVGGVVGVLLMRSSGAYAVRHRLTEPATRVPSARPK
jgi:hypothetical protein